MRIPLRAAAVVTLLATIPLLLPAQDTSKTRRVLRTIADAILKDATFQVIDVNTGGTYGSPEDVPPEASLKVKSAYNDWRYWNGVLNLALLRLTESLSDTTFASFVRQNIDFGFAIAPVFERRYAGENKWEYPFGQFFIMEELDDYGAMGASVVEVYVAKPQERYVEYISNAASFAKARQSRLDDGTFVRAFPERWTLWADDLYMSVSFLARYAQVFGDAGVFDDAARQVINFHKRLFDDTAGAMVHCWYAGGERPGVAFWGRANGWAILAQADLLDGLPADHPQRPRLLRLFRRHVDGIARRQSGEGLWHQLLDKPDSYLETSCSAMFTYAIARGVNRGLLEQRYAEVALKGWEGILSRIDARGMIAGVCAGTVVHDDLAYYYDRPTPPNDIHGIGAVLLAGTEVLALDRQRTR